MSEIIDEIAELNIKIEKHVRPFLGLKEGDIFHICFDPVDPKKPPSEPTLYLFMYLVHEDLQQRHGGGLRYLPGEGSFSAAQASVRCLYLATYWESEHSSGSDEEGASADSQSVRYLNRVIKALLNMRISPEFADCSVRTIEPETLDRLGNFWQAMGDKPRAIINFAVTLPVTYAEGTPGSTVTEIRPKLEQGVDVWPQLEEQLKGELQAGFVSKEALAHVELRVLPVVGGTADIRNGKNEARPVTLVLSGYVLDTYVESVKLMSSSLKDSTRQVADRYYHITGVDSESLIGVFSGKEE